MPDVIRLNVRPGIAFSAGFCVLQGEEKVPVDSYKLSSVKMAERLWRIAVEHHAFFR